MRGFFLMSQGSSTQKFGSKIKRCGLYLVYTRTDGHTDRQIEWLRWAPFQGFRIFSFNLSSRIGPILCLLNKPFDINNQDQNVIVFYMLMYLSFFSTIFSLDQSSVTLLWWTFLRQEVNRSSCQFPFSNIQIEYILII